MTVQHDEQGVAELGSKRTVGRDTKESLECLSLIILKRIVSLACEAADETVSIHQDIDWQDDVLTHPILLGKSNNSRKVLLLKPHEEENTSNASELVEADVD